jgi:hypothetical protein
MTTDTVEQTTRDGRNRPIVVECGLVVAVCAAAGLVFGIGWQYIANSGCDDEFLGCLGPAFIGLAIAAVVLPLSAWIALRLLKVPYAFGTAALVGILAVMGFGFGPTSHVIVELGVVWYLPLYTAVIAALVYLLLNATNRGRVSALACAAVAMVGYMWWGSAASDEYLIDQYRSVAPSWWTSNLPGWETQASLLYGDKQHIVLSPSGSGDYRIFVTTTDGVHEGCPTHADECEQLAPNAWTWRSGERRAIVAHEDSTTRIDGFGRLSMEDLQAVVDNLELVPVEELVDLE